MADSVLKSAINVKASGGRSRGKILIPVVILALLLAAGFGARYAFWVKTSNEALDLVADGHFRQAKQKALQSLELMRVLPDSKSYALNLRMLASIYACRRVFDEALIWNERLLEFDRKCWGEKSAEYAGDLSDIALIRRKQKNFPASEKLYQQVVSIFTRCPGKEDDAARNKALLAWIMIQENKNNEGLELIADSDDFLKRKFGEKSWERLIGLIGRAWLGLRETKISNKAGAALLGPDPEISLPPEDIQRDLDIAYEIATQPKDLEKSSAQTVVMLNLLAQMYVEIHEKEKALKLFEIAENNCRTSVFGGTKNLYMADILEPHAKYLRELGQSDKADMLLAEAKKIKNLKNPE